MTVEEYLHTSFENPDPEFRDGELLERNSCDSAFSETCVKLIFFFAHKGRFPRLHCRPSLRLKLRDNHYRVPDLCVFSPDEPTELIPSTPPLIVIEILSPGDRIEELASKLVEFRRWGVTHAWLVDPDSRRMYAYGSELEERLTLGIPALNLELRAADIFE